MISRDRRKELLLEIMSESGHNNIFLPITDLSKKELLSNLDPHFVFQDKFCVHMESDNNVIGPERIKGFRIDYVGKHKVIKVKTRLFVEDWIKDFEKVDIIKIYFFDDAGNPMDNFFDYDVDFKCFYLDCDYQFRDYLTPVYEFYILDSPIIK